MKNLQKIWKNYKKFEKNLQKIWKNLQKIVIKFKFKFKWFKNNQNGWKWVRIELNENNEMSGRTQFVWHLTASAKICRLMVSCSRRCRWPRPWHVGDAGRHWSNGPPSTPTQPNDNFVFFCFFLENEERGIG